MKTVVLFVKMKEDQRKKNAGRNSIYTRSLRKIAFIDNRYMSSSPDEDPKDNEHWEVKIVRENQSANGGGCFILKPLRRIPYENLSPLVHGMYEMSKDGDAVILTPTDQSKFWVMSPEAKRSIQRAYGDDTKAIVINHGDGMWSRRKPPEALLEGEAVRLLKDIG